jgi:hypothetical protein
VCKVCGLVTKRDVLIEEHGFKECISVINTKAHRIEKKELLKKINFAVFDYLQWNTENNDTNTNTNSTSSRNNSSSIKYKEKAFICIKRVRDHYQ